jgi:branched-chain amino acid transport system substrate-binding protein
MNPVRSFLSSGLIAVVSAWALVACGPSVGPVVKIGVAQPLSGSSAARGQDLVTGVKLAVSEINASGYKVAGTAVQFEVIAMDDKGDKEEAKKVAQALVEQKVNAVIGHLSSDVTEVVIPIYKSGIVPQLFTSSAAELTRLGEGNAFRVVANDVLQARAIAGYTVETLHANKVAILHEDTAFGAPMAKDVSVALVKLNKKVDLVQAVDNKTTDFAAFVAKLKAAPPDVLVAAVRDHQLLPLLAQMNAAGLSDVAVIVTSVAKTQVVPDLEFARSERISVRRRVPDQVSRCLQGRSGVGRALRLRRGLRAGRRDPTRPVGGSGRAARQAGDDRRHRTGDHHDALR